MVSLRWLWWVGLAACGPTEVTPIGSGGGGGGESFDTPYDVTRTRLQQTEDMTVAPYRSVACSTINGTEENSWYRVFSLADEGIDRPFTVYRVNFGVQTAIGDSRVKVSIGTYAGDAGSVELDPAAIDMLAMTTIPVPQGTSGQLQASFPAVEVPQSANLIVEIRSEGYTDGRYFYVGSTDSAESIPGYLRAPTCGIPNPLMTNAVGHSQTHLIIAVSGAY